MISKEEIKHIAKLAKIGLKEEELKMVEKDFSKILGYFDLLKEVEAGEVEGSEERGLFLREDFCEEKKDELIDLPQKRYFKVKSILK